jgi:hypothetical protein
VWNLVCHPEGKTQTEDEVTHAERSKQQADVRSLASCLAYFSTLKMEAVRSSETSAFLSDYTASHAVKSSNPNRLWLLEKVLSNAFGPEEVQRDRRNLHDTDCVPFTLIVMAE